MPTATITVAGITPPAAGRKQGKIIDADGNKWNVWGDKLQNYRMGVTYNITYDVQEFNNVPFNIIKTAEPAGQGASQPRQVSQPQSGGPIPAFDKAKDEHIFVCGALNNALSNTNINPMELQVTDIATFVQKLQQAWKQTLGAPRVSSAPRSEEGMSDSIPF